MKFTPHSHISPFDEFFDSGMDECISPFLTPKSRKWGKHLPLKSSLLALVFLLLSFSLKSVSLANISLLFTYFFAGVPALISSIEDLCEFEINIDTLMTLAAFLSILIGSGKEGGLLLVLFALSAAMEEAVRTKAKGSLLSIKKLSPSKAYVIREDGSLLEKGIRDIPLGAKILVKAGEVIPLDGRVVEGASSINLVHLTGENLPETKTIGDQVPQGARNLEGTLTLVVEHSASDSTVQKMIELITEAENAKPKLEVWFDKLGSRYALTIISLAGLIALTFPFFLSIPFLGKEGSIYRALAFLIAASPCALIIAVPVAYLSAISRAASRGILVKGGTALDRLASCQTIAFDKTGTLTTGKLTCIASEGGEQALSIAYALERNAIHPIATAICKLAEEKKISPAPLSTFRIVPGFGLEGVVAGKTVKIGNPDFIQVSPVETQDAVCTLLKIGDEPPLRFLFQDEIRSESKETIAGLKELGLHVLLLSGDHQESVQNVARKVGISEFSFHLRPQEKLHTIATLAKKENLAMVGDGMNDAPALMRATIGISMGKMGSQVAIDASDIVLLKDNISHVLWLVKKARKTKRIVLQNLFFASGAILFAAFPALMGIVPLWLAVLLHEGGTLLVGINALRLLNDDGKREIKSGARLRSQEI